MTSRMTIPCCSARHLQIMLQYTYLPAVA